MIHIATGGKLTMGKLTMKINFFLFFIIYFKFILKLK
jgi:hypothetical protein